MNTIVLLEQKEIFTVTGGTEENTQVTLWDTIKYSIVIMSGVFVLGILKYEGNHHNKTMKAKLIAAASALGTTTLIHVTEYMISTFLNILEERFFKQRENT